MSDSEEDSVGDSEESVDNLADLLAQLQLEAARNPPSRKYRCGVCKEVGQHFINDCPEAARTGKRTPYQGTHRGFGQYQCKECRRLWVSSRSWANATQDCQVCKIAIYPHSQKDRPVLSLQYSSPTRTRAGRREQTARDLARRAAAAPADKGVIRPHWTTGSKATAGARPLHKPKGWEGVCNEDLEHMSALCGKCRQIGYSCVKHR